MTATARTAPAAVSSDKGTYTYIAVFSAVLYTVLLIAPVIAGKLIEQFGLTPVQVGTLFSLELGAFSLATVPAYLWLRRLNLRTASYIFTAIVIAGNVVSGFVDDFGLLMIARLVTSLAAGSITVIILTLSGKTANPSRAFGIFVVFQLAMGALILAVFPSLFAGAGVSAIYWTMADLAVLCLLVVKRIDGEMLRSATPVAAESRNRVPVLKAAADMAAVLLFYIALSGVWSFIAQISARSGMDLSASSLVRSLATVGGILSALVATALGETPRRKLYLAAGYTGMALSILLLFGSPVLIQFAAAAVIFKFAGPSSCRTCCPRCPPFPAADT
ncbi:MFS transporter [Arthrobacter sp. OAP107]|uniref:MFS transporter n=1 Tax=Arthrobacter sp. OAP107 TaxID=3156445 RepID=UPI003394AB32